MKPESRESLKDLHGILTLLCAKGGKNHDDYEEAMADLGQMDTITFEAWRAAVEDAIQSSENK